MIELSKRVITIAKALKVQPPVKETLTKFLEHAVDIDDPLGNKMSGGYIFNVINSVVVDICVKRPEAISLVKCNSCGDTKEAIVYESCDYCFGDGFVEVTNTKAYKLLNNKKDNKTMSCVCCGGSGEYKTIIPCQDCKPED